MQQTASSHAKSSTGSSMTALRGAIDTRGAHVAVIGLGYVGLPLAMACAGAGYLVTGFDIDPEKALLLNAGQSYIDAVPGEELARQCRAGQFSATTDMAQLAQADVIVICVPTPLTRHREPDLRFVEATSETIAAHMRPGQLIVLESTTYPGTTENAVAPILARSGLEPGRDFFLGFSPEREDPGNRSFHTRSIPKIVSGIDESSAQLVEAFYAQVVEQVVTVSSARVAEAVKITENVFRAVNVALVNELKVIFERMDIDVWEVIDAAATKPFGYMPFYPGPGLGGHCIPIDPFYLTWCAREYGVPTRFIELAGEINTAMPRYVIGKLEEALDRHAGKALGQARVLTIGLAYKKNVADIRESPSLELIELMQARGTAVAFHDPHVAVVPETREHAALAGFASVELSPESLAGYDAVLIATDHDAVDYAMIAVHAALVVDTRNALGRRGLEPAVLVKA